MCTWLVNKSLSPHWSHFPYPDGLKQHGVGVILNPSQSTCSRVDGLMWGCLLQIRTTWCTQSICSVDVIGNEVLSCVIPVMKVFDAHWFEKVWAIYFLLCLWKWAALNLFWVTRRSQHFFWAPPPPRPWNRLHHHCTMSSLSNHFDFSVVIPGSIKDSETDTNIQMMFSWWYRRCLVGLCHKKNETLIID